MEIRSARKGESSFLSELEVFEEDIVSGSVYVAESDKEIIGFYGLSSVPTEHRLYFLFVEPKYIGKGIGKALWGHAIASSKLRGWSSLTFFADPFAWKNFYKHLGCKVKGSRESILGPQIEITFDIK